MGKSKFINKKLQDRTVDCKVQYDTKAVATRALALSYICLLSEALGEQNTEDEKFILDLIINSGMKEHLTPNEIKFVDGDRTQQDIIEFNWHYERLAVLLWTLGQKVDLTNWNKLVEAAKLIEIIHSRDGFVKKAKLINAKKIKEYEQKANEAYWICADAKVNNKPFSEYSKTPIDPEIAQERLAAIRWIFSHEQTDWDNCSADTYYPYK